MTKPIKEYSDSELTTALVKMLIKLGYNDADVIWFDPLENWNDLMPLVVGYGIELSKYGEKWIGDAYYFDGWPISSNKNPKRALAECLLKVLETKKDD